MQDEQPGATPEETPPWWAIIFPRESRKDIFNTQPFSQLTEEMEPALYLILRE